MPMHFTKVGLHINQFTPYVPPVPHEPAQVRQLVMEVMADTEPSIQVSQVVMEVMSDV